MKLAEREASSALSSDLTVPDGDETQRIAVRLDNAPSGPPQPGIDADDANRLLPCANPIRSRNRCQQYVNKTKTKREIE